MGNKGSSDKEEKPSQDESTGKEEKSTGEDKANAVLQWIPVVGTIYGIGSCIYYGATGDMKRCKERAKEAALSIAIDAGMALTAGAMAPVALGVRTGVRAGAKVGVKAGVAATKAVIKNAGKKVVKNAGKIAAKGVKGNAKALVKNAGKVVKNIPKVVKNIPKAVKDTTKSGIEGVKNVGRMVKNDGVIETAKHGARKAKDAVKDKFHQLADHAEEEIKIAKKIDGPNPNKIGGDGTPKGNGNGGQLLPENGDLRKRPGKGSGKGEAKSSGEGSKGGSGNSGSSGSGGGDKKGSGNSGSSGSGDGDKKGSGNSGSGGGDKKGSGNSGSGGGDKKDSGNSGSGDKKGSGNSGSGDKKGSGNSGSGGEDKKGSGNSGSGGGDKKGSGNSGSGGGDKKGSGSSGSGNSGSGGGDKKSSGNSGSGDKKGSGNSGSGDGDKKGSGNSGSSGSGDGDKKGSGDGGKGSDRGSGTDRLIRAQARALEREAEARKLFNEINQLPNEVFEYSNKSANSTITCKFYQVPENTNIRNVLHDLQYYDHMIDRNGRLKITPIAGAAKDEVASKCALRVEVKIGEEPFEFVLIPAQENQIFINFSKKIDPSRSHSYDEIMKLLDAGSANKNADCILEALSKERVSGQPINWGAMSAEQQEAAKELIVLTHIAESAVPPAQHVRDVLSLPEIARTKDKLKIPGGIGGIDKLARQYLREIQEGKKTFTQVFNTENGEFIIARVGGKKQVKTAVYKPGSNPDRKQFDPVAQDMSPSTRAADTPRNMEDGNP